MWLLPRLWHYPRKLGFPLGSVWSLKGTSAFVPGCCIYIHMYYFRFQSSTEDFVKELSNGFRISIPYPTFEEMRDGVHYLCEALKECIKEWVMDKCLFINARSWMSRLRLVDSYRGLRLYFLWGCKNSKLLLHDEVHLLAHHGYLVNVIPSFADGMTLVFIDSCCEWHCGELPEYDASTNRPRRERQWQ